MEAIDQIRGLIQLAKNKDCSILMITVSRDIMMSLRSGRHVIEVGRASTCFGIPISVGANRTSNLQACLDNRWVDRNGATRMAMDHRDVIYEPDAEIITARALAAAQTIAANETNPIWGMF